MMKYQELDLVLFSCNERWIGLRRVELGQAGGLSYVTLA
jgi:hypothetical protein